MEKLIKFGFTAEQIITEGRVTEQDINTLQAWLDTQKLPKLTNEQIVLFLLSCLNEHEATKTTIKAFNSVRNGAPQLFNDRKINRTDIQKQLMIIDFCVLPERTSDGCAIILGKFHDTDSSTFEFGPFLKLLFMTLDAALYDYPPKGLIMIIDMQGMGLWHLTKLKPGLIKAFFQYLQEGLPVRLKNIHVLNTVYFIDKILTLIRPFAKKEVLEMIHFHPKTLDMEQFYNQWIPKRCLPEDIGGDLPSIRVLHKENIKKLTDMETHFDAEELQRQSIN